MGIYLVLGLNCQLRTVGHEILVDALNPQEAVDGVARLQGENYRFVAAFAGDDEQVLTAPHGLSFPFRQERQSRCP